MSLAPAPPASSRAARAVMQGNRRRDTKPEVALRRTLHGLGLRYRVDLPIRVDERRPIRPDIAFTRARLVVFVDGCFWHRCPEHGTRPRANGTWWAETLDRNVARDQRDELRLNAAGWTVVRVWEHEDPASASHRIVDALLIARGGRKA